MNPRNIHRIHVTRRGDQLIVLSAKIQNQYKLIVIASPTFLTDFKSFFFPFSMIGLKIN